MVHLQKGANTCHAHQPRPMVYGLRPASRSKVGVYQGFRYPLVLVSFQRSCGLHVLLFYIFARMYVCDVINRNRVHVLKPLYTLVWIFRRKWRILIPRSMYCLWERFEVCCDWSNGNFAWILRFAKPPVLIHSICFYYCNVSRDV